MIDTVNVQYVGSKAKPLLREYNFIVRRALNDTSEFTLTIRNESFGSSRVRFQDAAEICALRLHRELAAFGNHPPKDRLGIAETDLDECRMTHATKVRR